MRADRAVYLARSRGDVSAALSPCRMQVPVSSGRAVAQEPQPGAPMTRWSAAQFRTKPGCKWSSPPPSLVRRRPRAGGVGAAAVRGFDPFPEAGVEERLTPAVAGTVPECHRLQAGRRRTGSMTSRRARAKFARACGADPDVLRSLRESEKLSEKDRGPAVDPDEPPMPATEHSAPPSASCTCAPGAPRPTTSHSPPAGY